MAPVSWIDQLEPLAPSTPKRGEESVNIPTGVESAHIEQARRNLDTEHDAIIAQARQEAEAIRQEAHTQAEALREAAWHEGFHQGEQHARSTAQEAVQAEWNDYQQNLREQMQAIVTGIAEARSVLWESHEDEIVAFVLDIARQVIKTEIAQNPEVVTAVIRNAIRRVADKENVRIRVSVTDAPKVKAMREDIMTLVDGLHNLEIIDDRRIGDGGCVIETNSGTIDAKIETQLAEIERTLDIQEHI